MAKVFMCSTEAQVLTTPLGSFPLAFADTWIWKFSPSEERLFVPFGSIWIYYQVAER
jgi:hypothetical protein